MKHFLSLFIVGVVCCLTQGQAKAATSSTKDNVIITLTIGNKSFLAVLVPNYYHERDLSQVINKL